MTIQKTHSHTIQDLLITVFVPVYNGEKYLNQTLTSIKNQSYTNIEVLLVDDSSTDGSKIILDKFVNDDDRFKIFVKKNGAIVPSSFNFIIPKIKGDYTFYSSQDDIFSIDLIEKMVLKQQETQADTILPDMEYYHENIKNNKRTIGLNGDRNVVLTPKKACEESLNWNIHGFALIKSSLLIEEIFPEDAFDSDDFVTRKLFLKSNKVVFCEGIFYYRQDNTNAITKTFSKKNFYTLNTVLKLFYLLEDNNFDKNRIVSMQFLLLFKFLELSAIHHFYDFETKAEKDEITLFLYDFRKKYLTQSFYQSNRNYAIKKLKLRFILLLLVYKVPVFFELLTKIYSKRLQKTMSKNSLSS